jgi:hypothetical protein
VRMVESGNRLGLAVEAGFHFRVVGEMRGKNFDRDGAV